jgi:hypothetical protein
MEEKLATLNLLNGGGDGTAGEATQEQPLPVVMPPSADSVHVLLKQALRADDHASLLNCLYNKDHKVSSWFSLLAMMQCDACLPFHLHCIRLYRQIFMVLKYDLIHHLLC